MCIIYCYYDGINMRQQQLQLPFIPIWRAFSFALLLTGNILGLAKATITTATTKVITTATTA